MTQVDITDDFQTENSARGGNELDITFKHIHRLHAKCICCILALT